jgi:uncharacterized oxidoreductase
MELTGNTLFITGGTSGIGRGLAEAFHQLGNRVVIAGRRQDALERVCAANPGMSSLVMDVTDLVSIRRAAAEVTKRFPDLNVVINNAGVQRTQDFASDQPFDDAAMLDEVNTNLVGLIRCCGAFIPQLRRVPRAAIVNVSSGLAFVPLARFPVYCATKAAVHSFSLSLRHQLKETGIRVVELIPPYVATELDRTTRETKPHDGPPPMPLADFVAEAMKELAGGGDELAVAGAKFLRSAGVNEQSGPAVFARLNG